LASAGLTRSSLSLVPHPHLFLTLTRSSPSLVPHPHSPPDDQDWYWSSGVKHYIYCLLICHTTLSWWPTLTKASVGYQESIHTPPNDWSWLLGEVRHCQCPTGHRGRLNSSWWPILFIERVYTHPMTSIIHQSVCIPIDQCWSSGEHLTNVGHWEGIWPMSVIGKAFDQGQSLGEHTLSMTDTVIGKVYTLLMTNISHWESEDSPNDWYWWLEEYGLSQWPVLAIGKA
jgi:hypothetical protein